MIIPLTKYISSSGYCSRRKAEELIRLGKVEVNGERAGLGMKVSVKDKVKVNGTSLGLPEEKIYIILNKPFGYTCTSREFKGEKNVFALLKNIETRLIASLHVAGRLDKNSRGLVLLTNDGDLTELLTHPRYAHEKFYIVQINTDKKQMNTEHGYARIVRKFKEGVDIGDGDGIVKTKAVKYLRAGKFKIVLTEGKKRQIRRMFKAVGLEVLDLQRVRIGKLQLGNLKEGEWKIINKNDIV